METFLWSIKFLGTLAALVSVVPLAIWAMSGSWRHALFALKQYLLIMGGFVVVGVGLGVLSIIAS